MSRANARLITDDRAWMAWSREGLGGAVAALFTLPGALAFGTIALSSLGEAGQQIGVAAGLVGAVVGGLVAAWLSGTPGGISAPSGQLAVLLAAGVAAVAGPIGDPLLVGCLAGLTVAMSGLVLLGIGLVRLGAIITYVPYPVVAGCAIGAGAVIASHQVAPLLGLPAHLGMSDVLSGTMAVRPAAALVGAAAILGVMLGHMVPKVPDVVVGFVAGWTVHLLLDVCWPGSVGPSLATPSAMALVATQVDVVATSPAAWKALLRLVPVAIGMGLLAAVLSLVAAAIANGVTHRRGDSNRELVAQGLANIVGGLCGGIAVGLSESRTLASWQAGGRGRLAGVAHALTLLVAGTLGAPVIVHVPRAVLAGLLLVIVVRAVDPWAVDMLRLALPGRGAGRLPAREVAANVAIIALVAGLTVGAGMFWALLAGLLVAIVQFIASMSGSPVRRILRGDALRSKKLRSERAMDLLARHGHEIALCELQGPLFFGTADRLARETERLLADGARSLILDCERVTSVDSSGVRMVQRVHDECLAHGGRLLLAQLDSAHPGYAAFRGLGVLDRLGDDGVHADTDAALEHAEEAILAPYRVDGASDETALEGLGICQDLSATECATLAGYMERRRYEAGRTIFHEGDPGTELFILMVGEVSVSTALDDGRTVRLATFSAGVVFGEMALLDGSPRSASLVTDLESVCLVLSVERYHDLAREHPAIARRFTLNLARQLAERLRRANSQIRALER